LVAVFLKRDRKVLIKLCRSDLVVFAGVIVFSACAAWASVVGVCVLDVASGVADVAG
jgi:hypothetical protein